MALLRHSTTKRLQIRDELANPSLTHSIDTVVRRLPAMNGAPIRLTKAAGLRDARGPVHAGSFLRERRIAFDCTQAEFPRILVHELFHFVWLRLGNPARHSWETVVSAEFRSNSRGELGWSAQWRRDAQNESDVVRRSRAWRLYCCESFCDTAAWLYCGLGSHPEFTLAANFRRIRRKWFLATIETRQLSI
jgi:hypothetical protein